MTHPAHVVLVQIDRTMQPTTDGMGDGGWLETLGLDRPEILRGRLSEYQIDAEILTAGRLEGPSDQRQLERASTELTLFDWIVFEQPYAVDALLEAAGGFLPERTLVAAGGPAVAARLGTWERSAHVVAHAQHDDGSLLRQLGPRLGRRERLLLIEDEAAPSSLGVELTEEGGEAVTVAGYALRPLASNSADFERTARNQAVWVPTMPCAAQLVIRQAPHLAAHPWLALHAEAADELLGLGIEPLAVAGEVGVETLVERLRGPLRH